MVRRRSRQILGFTLIELLIVVGIIALLMGILLPALGRARQEAMKISCASNLRQWGTASNAFAADNNNRLPQAGPSEFHGDRPLIHADTRLEPDHPWHAFLRTYLIPDDPDAAYEGDYVLKWCPAGSDFHRPWATVVLGYFYFPNRSLNAGFWYAPSTEGWASKNRLDGPHSRAPIMSDEHWRVNGEVDWYNAGTGTSLAAHRSAADSTVTLGSNFLSEDVSVRWENVDQIGVGGGWADREYYFHIAIPGIVHDSELQ